MRDNFWEQFRDCKDFLEAEYDLASIVVEESYDAQHTSLYFKAYAIKNMVEGLLHDLNQLGAYIVNTDVSDVE